MPSAFCDQSMRFSLLPAFQAKPLSSSYRDTRVAHLKRTAAVGLRRGPVGTKALFGGGGTKTASTAYICKDCGYIYDERQPFESLDKSYRCPVCSAPKRRFTVYNQPVARGANKTATRKERKTELQAGGSNGGLNPGVVIGVGAVVIVAAFLYLNSVY